MADRPKKLSNFTGLEGKEAKEIEDYIRTLDNDIFRIVQYLDRFPRMLRQATQPTVQRNTHMFWEDTDNNKFYLLKDINGTTKTVELT